MLAFFAQPGTQLPQSRYLQIDSPPTIARICAVVALRDRAGVGSIRSVCYSNGLCSGARYRAARYINVTSGQFAGASEALFLFRWGEARPPRDPRGHQSIGIGDSELAAAVMHSKNVLCGPRRSSANFAKSLIRVGLVCNRTKFRFSSSESAHEHHFSSG